MSGQWPPEWDDPDEIPEEAEQQDAETAAGLSEVAAYLASVPAPVMPGTVEARISAALAVEAASRPGLAAPADGGGERDAITQPGGTVQPGGLPGARVLGPAPARPRLRRREARALYGERDVRTTLGRFVLGPLAVCLLIAVIAIGLSHVGSSSSSSSSSSSASSAAGAAPAAGNTFAPAASSSAGSAAGPFAAPSATRVAAGFLVTESGTRYQRATLASQARSQVAAAARQLGSATAPSSAAPASSPVTSSASASSSRVTSSAPTAQLRGCVLRVTGGVPPRLVDRATYQGTPAYVIVSSTRVWVVSLGCTAATPQVIAAEPLAG
jgi:hypothetical protein